LIPCNSCGRSFNEKALSRHAKVCKKVFVEKRKEFNSAAARKPEELIAMENESKMSKKKSKKSTVVSRNNDSSVDKNYDDQALNNANAEKKAKWKAQSEQLRLAMKVSKGGGLSQEEQVQMKKLTEDADTRKQCCFCSRKFNDEA